MRYLLINIKQAIISGGRCQYQPSNCEDINQQDDARWSGAAPPSNPRSQNATKLNRDNAANQGHSRNYALGGFGLGSWLKRNIGEIMVHSKPH